MIRLATFNLCNFCSTVDLDRLDRMAAVIVRDLSGPDLLAFQEVGAAGPAGENGQAPADAAYRQLIDAITARSGPCYEFREVAPLENRDGGQAGLNIRVGMLFNPDRMSFVDRGAAGPEDTVAVICRAGRPALSLSPGRIEPADPAFAGDPHRHWRPSRKTLAAELRIGGQTLFVIVCHFKSMRAESRRAEEYGKKQRHAQAEVVYRFVAKLLHCNPDARVVVMGDMNDVPGSKTLKLLKGESLENLVETIKKRERYTRLHGSTRQALDHILVSKGLVHAARAYIPHVNADFSDDRRASDHDPVLAEIDLKMD